MNPHDPLRDTLRDYHVPVDKAKLWAQTSHAIPDRRRRRIVPLWWLGAMAGAGLVVLGLIVLPARYRMDGKPPANKQAQQSAASAVDPAHRVPHAIGQAEEEDALHSATPSPAAHTQSKSQATPSANITRRGVSAERSASSAAATSNRVEEPDESNVNSMTHNPDASTPGHSLDEVLLPESRNPLHDPAMADAKADPRAEAETPKRQSRTGEMGISDPVDALPISGLDREMPDPAMNLPAAEWKFSKARPAFYLAVLQGIGFSGVSIEASAIAGQPQAERWQESLKSLEYLNASLEGGIRLPKGWQVGLGMRYGQLTTAQTYQWTTTERITGEGTSVVIIGEDGSTTSVTGDVSSTRRTTSEATRFNYHRTLDLDLLLAVPLWRRPGFALSGWLRGGLNLWYDVEGSVPDADWRPVPIDPSASPFTLATPFTWSAGLEARYQLSRHFSVHARASSDRLRYGLAGEGYDIRFKHHMTSFSLGVGYVR